MDLVTGTGTTWNLPNYAGELFTADSTNTPILSMIGGLTGGKTTTNYEFPINSEYSLEAPNQPAISEQASLTAPEPTNVTRGQNTNVTQIFQESVSISYVKMSNSGRLEGLNTAGQQNNVPSEKAFQIARKLEKMARDVEYTIINGVYVKSTAVDKPNKTRGLLSLCKGQGGNKVDAGTKPLTREMLQQLFKMMYDAGAIFNNLVLWTNSTQKQIITDLYAYAPTDRNIGGVNVKQIETDFGNIGISLNRFMPQGDLLAAEMSALDAVFQPVPEKGNFFYEELSRKGAAEEGQLFGQFGLDHGAACLHGCITNLAGE